MTINEIIENAKKQAVIDQLQDMDSETLLSIYNEYVTETNCYDDEIFTNDEEFFEDILAGYSRYQIAEMCCHGDYHVFHDYVKFDGYGNLESAYCWEDLADWDEDVITEYLIDNEHWQVDWDEVEELVELAINQATAEAIKEITACEDAEEKFQDVWDDIIDTVKADEDTEVIQVVEDYLNELWEE